MASALFVIDLQNDFVDRIPGGVAVAAAVTAHLREHAGDYDIVVASRDWHDGDNDNGGHFPAAPPGSPHPWIRHCVAGTPGAQYAPHFDTTAVDVHVKKGQGRPDYSLFRGITDEGEPFPEFVRRAGIDRVTVVGLATEYCVRAGALDALALGLEVTVLDALVGGYGDEARERTYVELRERGARIIPR